MMKYKLIAADIDGTLLNSRGELTDKTIAAVKEFITRGGIFVLSTGRPLQGIGKFVSALGLENMPYIIYNGAMVTIGDVVKYSVTIPQKTAIELMEFGREKGVARICWANNKLYAESDCERVTFYKSVSKVEPIFVKDLKDVCGEGVTKFVWLSSEQKTKENYEFLKKKFEGRLNVFPSRVDFLEFVSVESSKAKALAAVAESFCFSIDECAAVGDGYNDVDMLRFAGLGVAMGNADDYVKSNCDYITDSCDEDGVAHFIEKCVL